MVISIFWYDNYYIIIIIIIYNQLLNNVMSIGLMTQISTEFSFPSYNVTLAFWGMIYILYFY